MGVHRTEHRVIFADTDAMGIVYHANYLRFFESARSEWFRELFIHPMEMIANDNYVIVVEANVKYHAPAKFDDILLIDCWIPAEHVRQASWRFEHIAWDKATGRKLVTANTVHALCTSTGKLKRMPREFQARVRDLATTDAPHPHDATHLPADTNLPKF
ncbi:MAG: acyl-CoA thioesterase [Deltaproteobacteria bacterium]|nr:acyl-CoA thioesterase [Deltaproteobacteria bacterium]